MASFSEVCVEHASGAVADHIQWTGHWVGRHWQTTGHGLHQHQPEGVGTAGKHEHTRLTVDVGKFGVSLHTEEVHVRMAASKRIQFGSPTRDPLFARQVQSAVRRTFITPFDRSDIRDLAGALDDAIDQMHRTAKTVLLFDQREFEPDMRALGDLILRAADLTQEAIPLLRNLRAGAARLNAIAEEITAIEEESDRLCDEGRRALYLGAGRTDPTVFLVRGEIYQNLEKVVDRFEDVSNQISGMLIEHL